MTDTIDIELYRKAHANGTEITQRELPATKSMSIMLRDGSTYIGISPSFDSSAEERVHLAHEIGHCVTGSFYNIYSPFDIREKHENKANAWAIRMLIPEDELRYIYTHGYVSIDEIADYFDVTEDFVKRAARFYNLI